MLSIRFLRIGRKHHPSYKIVVIDKKRAPKSGKFIEQLGFYNPITKEKGIDKERVKQWLSYGAQPSDTVHNFLIKEGVIEGKKIAVHGTRKKKGEEAKQASPIEGENKSTIETKTEAKTEAKPETKEGGVSEKAKEAPKKETPVVEKVLEKTEESPAPRSETKPEIGLEMEPEKKVSGEEKKEVDKEK